MSTTTPFWYTTDSADCVTAQNSFDSLTLEMNGFNFTIPSTAFIIDFNIVNEFTDLFDHNKCVFMMMPDYDGTGPNNHSWGLGQAFMWQFYTALDFDNNNFVFGVNPYAEAGTSVVYNNYVPPVPTGTAAINLFPTQQRPENYIVEKNFTIGLEQVTNMTVDIFSAVSFVNSIDCDHCHVYTNTSTPAATFASYDPALSVTYVDLNIPFETTESVMSLYGGFTNVTGNWAKDIVNTQNGV